MDDLHDPSNVDLDHYIPYIGKHLEGWKDVKDHNDAVIIRLSGLSNVTCLVKARDKTVQPRYLIFRRFNNDLCESEIESMVFQTLSEEGLGPKCYFQNEKYRLEQSFDSRPITIFEMRNPIFMNQIIDMTFKINFNQPLKDRLLEAKGGKFPTQIEILTTDWLPKLFDKFQHYYDIITVDEYREVMDLVKERWLRDDIYEHIKALCYKMQDDPDALVVCHNDIQENNILSMRSHAAKLAIIDYEYTSLGNREYDLANIFCELLMDNAHPYFPFIELYTENALTKEEYETYSKHYLKLWYKDAYTGDLSESDYIEQELPTFLENLYCSMKLNGYYWGIWSILMISEKTINDKIFNFAFAKKRIELADFLMSQDFVKEAVENRFKQYAESKA